jgi:hypothetical protein
MLDRGDCTALALRVDFLNEKCGLRKRRARPRYAEAPFQFVASKEV